MNNIHGDEAKKIKMADSKKLEFFKTVNSHFFFKNFMDR